MIMIMELLSKLSESISHTFIITFQGKEMDHNEL